MGRNGTQHFNKVNIRDCRRHSGTQHSETRGDAEWDMRGLRMGRDGTQNGTRGDTTPQPMIGEETAGRNLPSDKNYHLRKTISK